MTLACSMLYVKNFALMREFYAKMLQTQPINSQWADTWALFDVGGTGFALHAISGEHTDVPSLSPKSEQSPVKLIFEVEDLSSERARLQAMGVELLQRDWQDAAESCDCVDPEGNVFQIAAQSRVKQLFGNHR